MSRGNWTLSPEGMETFQFFRGLRRQMEFQVLLGGDLDSTVHSMWVDWDFVVRGYVPGKGGWHGFVYRRGDAWGVTVVSQRHARDWDTATRQSRRTRSERMREHTFAGESLERLLRWLGDANADPAWAAIRALLQAEPLTSQEWRFLIAMGTLGDRVAAIQAEADRSPRRRR